MPTYKEYQEEIARLQGLAEAARKAEIADARNQIRQLMDTYSITAADVFKHGLDNVQKRRSAAKFRDPVSGKTWSGQGRAPRWLDKNSLDKYRI